MAVDDPGENIREIAERIDVVEFAGLDQRCDGGPVVGAAIRASGRKVLVRRIAQRATGQFLSVQGPAGIVVLIAGWMLDPVICAGMTIGAPRVDLATLVELKRLLIGLATPAHSQSDVGIVREESNEVSQIAGAGAQPANETPIRQKPARWGGTRRAERDHLGAGSNSHAGGRPAGRGA
jgi:hypothetical protein